MKNKRSCGNAEVANVVISTLQEILSRKNRSTEEPVLKSAPLAGTEGILDSLDLITLVVDVEQQLEEEYGVSVVITDGRTASEVDHPFETVQSLTAHISSLIDPLHNT